MAEAKALPATSTDDNEMSISQEILVLDFGDEQSSQYRDDPDGIPANYKNNHSSKLNVYHISLTASTAALGLHQNYFKRVINVYRSGWIDCLMAA